MLSGQPSEWLPFTGVKFLFPGSVCPSPELPTPGQPCALPGALNCHYELDCCGRCSGNFSCVTDDSTTTDVGLWQLPACLVDCCGSHGGYKLACLDMHIVCISFMGKSRLMLPCVLFSTWVFSNHCFWTGVVCSPNYPKNYPHNFTRTDTIRVKDGLVLTLQFTAFNVEDSSDNNCSYDHLRITDGNQTTVMEKMCGTALPAKMTSSSNNLARITWLQNLAGVWTGQQ